MAFARQPRRAPQDLASAGYQVSTRLMFMHAARHFWNCKTLANFTNNILQHQLFNYSYITAATNIGQDAVIPEIDCLREASPDRASTSSEDSFQASIPLRLQLTGSASGNPDLRLQLLSFRHGTACQQVQRLPVDHRNAWMSGTCKHRLQPTFDAFCQPYSHICCQFLSSDRDSALCGT